MNKDCLLSKKLNIMILIFIFLIVTLFTVFHFSLLKKNSYFDEYHIIYSDNNSNINFLSYKDNKINTKSLCNNNQECIVTRFDDDNLIGFNIINGEQYISLFNIPSQTFKTIDSMKNILKKSFCPKFKGIVDCSNIYYYNNYVYFYDDYSVYSIDIINKKIEKLFNAPYINEILINNKEEKLYYNYYNKYKNTHILAFYSLKTGYRKDIKSNVRTFEINEDCNKIVYEDMNDNVFVCDYKSFNNKKRINIKDCIFRSDYNEVYGSEKYIPNKYLYSFSKNSENIIIAKNYMYLISLLDEYSSEIYIYNIKQNKLKKIYKLKKFESIDKLIITK